MLQPPRFIADCHLGKLAKYLRLLGFDTQYFQQITDDALITLSKADARIILTRDRQLAKRYREGSYFVNAVATRDQLEELIGMFSLKTCAEPLTRCLVCNGLLVPVEKGEIVDQVPPKVARLFHYFDRCTVCRKIYWHGSHYKRMNQFAATLLKSV